MKKFFSVIISVILMGTLVACTGGDKESKTDSTGNNDISNPERDPNETVIERSLFSVGRAERIQQKINQAKSGEETTIGYIGGSITEGLNGGAEKCYAKLSYNKFSEKYGTGDNVKYVNAGMSGTPSVLGNIRAERDLLQYNPDIIFIEFAVNDGQDETHKESYESLIRQCLSQENDPAVILIFNVLENGYTAQAHMKELGEYYELPMISVADALTREFEAGRMVWTDYSDDGSHPHVEGHKLVAEMVDYMFSKTSEAPYDTVMWTIPENKFSKAYENAKLLDMNSLEATDLGSFEKGTTISQFPDGWAKVSGAGNESIKFNIKAKTVFLLYKVNKSGNLGSAEVTINGEEPIIINGTTDDGWNNPVYFQLRKRAVLQDYEIEIKMVSGDEEKDFEILGFGYTE